MTILQQIDDMRAAYGAGPLYGQFVGLLDAMLAEYQLRMLTAPLDALPRLQAAARQVQLLRDVMRAPDEAHAAPLIS